MPKKTKLRPLVQSKVQGKSRFTRKQIRDAIKKVQAEEAPVAEPTLDTPPKEDPHT